MPLEGVRPANALDHRPRIPLAALIHDPSEVFPALGYHIIPLPRRVSVQQLLLPPLVTPRRLVEQHDPDQSVVPGG